MTYSALWTGTMLGTRLGGGVSITIEERNELFKWGDQSRLAILKSNGLSIGNIFVARKGKSCFFMILYGVYFDDSESLKELLLPTLSLLE